MRVFDTVSLRMQRVGYLKRLIKRIVTTPTSNLENVGHDLIEVVSKRIRYQVDETVATYIKARLTGNSYTTIKKQTKIWLKEGGDAPYVLMELQDLYLANPSLASQVGRLTKEDWRKYPQFGMSLGFIRQGTYSATTRSFSFLHLISEKEQQAFSEYLPETNPFFVSFEQSLLLIFSFIENDGEILLPIWRRLLEFSDSSFTERDAGNLLPNIIRNVINRYKGKSNSVEVRKKLESLAKIADHIALQLNIQDYSGASPREEYARIRLEPTVDLGILQKANPFRYEYGFTDIGRILGNTFTGDEDGLAIDSFLHQRYFSTMAAAKGLSAKTISTEEIIPRLHASWKTISSANGYAPIEEIALLAGIKSLVEDNMIIEIATARDALITFQKDNPYLVRFTVDRLGVLAHAKFVDETNR